MPDEFLEVSVTDVVPESAPENGVPSRSEMWFVGFSKEEKTRLVTFKQPREVGELILKALVQGEEPACWLSPEMILLVQDLEKIQEKLRDQAPVQMQSPFQAVTGIAPTPRPVQVIEREQALLRSIEALAQAAVALNKSREENNDVFRTATVYREREAAVGSAIEAIVSARVQELEQ